MVLKAIAVEKSPKGQGLGFKASGKKHENFMIHYHHLTAPGKILCPKYPTP